MKHRSSPAVHLDVPQNLLSESCCGGGECSTGPSDESGGSGGLRRRTFLGGISAAATAGLWANDAIAVPRDKGLTRRWLAAAAARGEPTQYSGEALNNIGMPVGGACSGQVYLSGDGRLWLWDVFNSDGFRYGGADWQGLHYANPLELAAPFQIAFAIRVDGQTRTLDAGGFSDVTFTGQYPIGKVAYRDDGSPVAVDLEAFSPFIPTATTDSSLPATILDYTIRNSSGSVVTVELAGLTENPVCVDSRRSQPITLVADAAGSNGIQFAAEQNLGPQPERPDIAFEDWERATYDGWTVEGTAFGDGPVELSTIPSYMLLTGNIGATGTRFVTSHQFRNGDDIPGADQHQGKLISQPFTIERSSIVARVGGGNAPEQARLDVVVDGQVVATATGRNEEALHTAWLDVSEHQGKSATIEIVDAHTGAWGHINVDGIVFTDRPGPSADVVIENWERTNYDGWTVEGTAFGPGPVTEAECPGYFRREGPLNVNGQRFVTSHNWRDTSTPADDHKGKLTSQPVTIERRYFAANVAGGNQESVGVRLVVYGEVVARLAGRNSEILTSKAVDVSAHIGKTATIEIVDDATGGWAHVNCDRIWFSDLPVVERPPNDLPDAGTFALAAIGGAVTAKPSVAEWANADDWFDAADGPAEVDAGKTKQAGAVVASVQLEPDQSTTIRYIVAWHFPTIDRRLFNYLTGVAGMRRHYATVHQDAAAVVSAIAERGDELAEQTRKFVTTWYADSTLPHWFLERTLVPASTVATNTVHRFSDGRFYAWEGIYCCDGTCTHVWNYAQSIARLFPDLERDTRERVDFGVAFHDDTGAIDYRGEAARREAHDGQCGNVLRTYREHQMAPDGSFLQAVWPEVKKATQFLIQHDGEPDGILEAEQYNTLDASWFGEIPWISGLYIAALRAAAEMADDAGDAAFAATCRSLADQGTAQLDSRMWNADYGYYEHLIDPAHPGAINSNRGCHIDQMYGQTYAHQLGLPRVFTEEHSKTALASIFTNNFLPDAQAYKDQSGIPGGRVYSTEGEAGTVMCTWPHGGSDTAPGDGEPIFIAYFNEVWTGQEYQLAAHMMAEGMVDEALAVTQAVHNRHTAEKRNPYNEIECSDHYARAMMSHAVYLAATGFEYHGPRGHLGFAPRLRPHNFSAAFTVAEGWGLYRQHRANTTQTSEVELRYGKVRLRTFAAQLPDGSRGAATAELVTNRRRQKLPVADVAIDGSRAVVKLAEPVVVAAGESLTVTIA